jgi:hypothetical protein
MDVLHDEIIRADIIEMANIGMTQRSNCSRLAFEAFRELLLGDFDSDIAAESGIVGLINLSHAAFTQLGSNTVMGDCGSDHASPLYSVWRIRQTPEKHHLHVVRKAAEQICSRGPGICPEFSERISVSGSEIGVPSYNPRVFPFPMDEKPRYRRSAVTHL